jgi:phenylalanyl-tRNA synthetase beta chain
VEVENPLDRSESILRTALLPGLLKAARFNADRQVDAVCLFEMGHVFALPDGEAITPIESEHLGVIVTTPEPGSSGRVGGGGVAVAVARTWQYLADALRLEAPALVQAHLPGWHPGRSARIVGVGGRPLGGLGEVDPAVVEAYGLRPRVGYLTLSVDALLDEPRRPRQAQDVSKFPASDMDLAFVVDDGVPAAAVRGTLLETGGDLLESVGLFDVYRGGQVGEGRRSLAYRLRFRAPDRTLDDNELAAVRRRLIDAVVATHGAELRT